MYSRSIRYLFVTLCLIAMCSAVQATILQVYVVDGIDNSSIPRATVFLDGANLGRTTNNGEFVIQHSGLNDLNIRVSMNGYDDWSKIIIKNETSVLASLTRKSLVLNVKVFDSDTIQPIYGANVSLSAMNFSQSKQTDISGSATFGVTAETIYSAIITATNYQPRSETIDVGQESMDVQYYLLSGQRFSFVAQDKDSLKPIPDAEVRLDGTLMGKTDARGILITPVSRGKFYTIQIKKDGYETFAESRMIGATDAIFNALMTRSSVGAFIFVTDEANSPVSDADVYMGGSSVAKTNQFGRAVLPSLVSGTYTIEVRKAGYANTARQIDLSNIGNDFAVVLPYQTTDLTIFVQDKEQKNIPNATLTVNGGIVGVTDSHGQFVLKVKYNTAYNLTSSKDGYLTASVQKTMTMGNETPAVTISLEKNTDWNLITLIGIGVIIVIALFAIIRIVGRRKKRHVVIKKNEL